MFDTKLGNGRVIRHRQKTTKKPKSLDWTCNIHTRVNVPDNDIRLFNQTPDLFAVEHIDQKGTSVRMTAYESF